MKIQRTATMPLHTELGLFFIFTFYKYASPTGSKKSGFHLCFICGLKFKHPLPRSSTPNCHWPPGWVFAGERARPGGRFRRRTRPKRQRAGALQDASRHPGIIGQRASVLECGGPPPLFHRAPNPQAVPNTLCPFGFFICRRWRFAAREPGPGQAGRCGGPGRPRAGR